MTTTIIKNTNIKINNKIDLVIGVYDVGLTNWITLSDGQVIDRPKFLKVMKENQDSNISARNPTSFEW
ncbi:MAG TPA: hypothetical protein VFI70_09755 [Nitrososphaeraceae archaeon]|nr:hypothetical protein [Nitrososphaeraceae archaeon]